MKNIKQPTIGKKIGEHERKCLEVLALHFAEDANCLYMRYIAKETKLSLVRVRRAVRSLARKGLAVLERGLMDDDGMVAGSGYRATSEGADMFKPCIVCYDAIGNAASGQCDECFSKSVREFK